MMKIDSQIIFILYLEQKTEKYILIQSLLYKQRYERGYISTLHHKATTTNVFLKLPNNKDFV